MPDRTGSPPLHFHTNQLETFTVLKGTMAYESNGTIGTANVEERIVIPLNVIHQFWNPRFSIRSGTLCYLWLSKMLVGV